MINNSANHSRLIIDVSCVNNFVHSWLNAPHLRHHIVASIRAAPFAPIDQGATAAIATIIIVVVVVVVVVVVLVVVVIAAGDEE